MNSATRMYCSVYFIGQTFQVWLQSRSKVTLCNAGKDTVYASKRTHPVAFHCSLHDLNFWPWPFSTLFIIPFFVGSLLAFTAASGTTLTTRFWAWPGLFVFIWSWTLPERLQVHRISTKQKNVSQNSEYMWPLS